MNQNNQVNCIFYVANIQTCAYVYIYMCTYIYLHLYEHPRLFLPQGAPRPTDAFSICHKAIEQEYMPTSGGRLDTHRHIQLWIYKVSTRIVLIVTQYGPVERREVPWLSNKQNQLHEHSPFTLNVSGSSPCCCNCGLNSSASRISICFITRQCNLKIHWLVSKAKPVSEAKKVT